MAVSWPASLHTPAEFDMALEVRQTISASELDGSRIVAPRYSLWRAMVTWTTTTHDQAHAVEGFLDSLRGETTAVHVPNLKYRQQLGDASGTIVTDGAHSAGVISVDVTGMSGDFAVGDMVHISQSGVQRLYRITADTAQAGGDATLTIAPPLRVDVISGTVVSYIPLVPRLNCPMVLVGGTGKASVFPSPEPKLMRERTVEFIELIREVV